MHWTGLHPPKPASSTPDPHDVLMIDHTQDHRRRKSIRHPMLPGPNREVACDTRRRTGEADITREAGQVDHSRTGAVGHLLRLPIPCQ